MKKTLILLLITSFVLVGCFNKYNSSDTTADDQGGPTVAAIKVSNGAYEYCEDQGGNLELTMEDENGLQKSICAFDDGSECETELFFQGKCAPGQSLK